MKTETAHNLKNAEAQRAETAATGARTAESARSSPCESKTRTRRSALRENLRRLRRSWEIKLQRTQSHAKKGRELFLCDSPRSLHLCVCALLLVTFLYQSSAATNDLSGLLQRGLFEEEANRNLDAAAQAYQTVSAQFDKDRKLAATAIFRLGEIYRKQGKTNEATAQYERIMREFSDQETLTTLSRQNLTGLRTVAPPFDPTGFRERLQTIIQRASTPSVPSPVSTDDEEQEIRRIQVMIQNSPDLINGPAEGDSPLFTAAGAGRLRVATFLLDNGANVNKASGGRTPLHYAVQFGNKAMVELLLQRGADVNAKDGTGGTPLHLAAQSGFLSIAEVLVKHKADLNARNFKSNGEQSPLHLAARNGHAALVGFLLANGDDANRRDGGGQTPLHLVAALGRDSVVERLLKAGADVNATDAAGETPLIEAAQRGHSVSVKALLTAKAKPDVMDSQERTALSFAAEKGDIDSVKALLAAKADPNASRLNLPLHTAILAKSPATVEELLRAGADVNRVAAIKYRERNGSITAITEFNCNPLYLAVYENNLEAVKLLLQFKADSNSTGPSKAAVIFDAIGNIPILKALLESGASPNVIDANGSSPLLRSVKNKSKDAVSLLLGAGTDIGFVSKDGWSPLLVAVAQGNKDIAALLLDKGADPNQRPNGGQTALEMSKSHASTSLSLSEDLAALLRQHGALDDLPKMDRIEVRRPQTGYSAVFFWKGTNDWNRFTLLDVLYGIYFSSGLNFQHGQPTSFAERLSNQSSVSTLPFPDLHKIVVVRATNKAGQPASRIVVDLILPTGGVDCAKDVPLEFGDVVEIPEREHTLQESAVGLKGEELQQIARCREGTVGLVVRGKRMELKVWPTSQQASISQILQREEIRSALFSSSDLSRVSVTRREGASTKPREWIVDCSGGKTPDLWLRDGDVIEVPDKK